MSYVVNKTNGQTLTIIADGTLDTSTGLYLIGRNYKNYGEFTAENFVRLAENFANVNPPNAPLEGQLWWNTQTKLLNVYQGKQFKSLLSGTVGSIKPVENRMLGDFWWNVNENRLYVFNGAEWTLVGPQAVPTAPGTYIDIQSVLDISNNEHPVILLVSNGIVVAVISSDPTFTLLQPINALFEVSPGINLTYGQKLYGTATDSDKLDGAPASAYVRTNVDSEISANVSITEIGKLRLGAGNNLQISSQNNLATIESLATDLRIVVSGQTALVISSVDSHVGTFQSPSNSTDLTNKQYVDNKALDVLSTSNDYTDNAFNSLKGSPPLQLSTVELLATAINNDPNYSSNVNLALSTKANLDSPIFIGIPRAPTPDINDNSTLIATTAFVKNNLDALNVNLNQYTPQHNPVFTGTVIAPTPVTGDNSTKVATTEFVKSEIASAIAGTSVDLSLFAPINSPIFSGVPTAPTANPEDSSNRIATTQWVRNHSGNYAPINSPVFTGIPRAPIPDITDSSNRIATTSFVKATSTLPSGVIVMWSGSSIPSGWALCDGTNGTPDLRDRFIVGAGEEGFQPEHTELNEEYRGDWIHIWPQTSSESVTWLPRRYGLAFIMKL